MDKLNKAINLALDKFYKEYGTDAKLEDGDEIAAVYNDGVIIISFENNKLGIKVVAGEPYRIDFNLDLLESEEEK